MEKLELLMNNMKKLSLALMQLGVALTVLPILALLLWALILFII